MTPPSQVDYDHEKIVEKIESMNTGIRESLRAIHDDLRKVVVEVNGKYNDMKDALNNEIVIRTQLEGRIAVIEKTSNDNESLWKKVIYAGVTAGTLAVLAGLAKLGGVI